MKPIKHPLASSSKLAGVPELNYKKGLLNSPLSPKLKEKQSSKLVREKLEPVVLRSPPTGESVVRYALPIPSSKTKELIAEDELLRKITKQLKMVVSSLEETFGSCSENVEKPVVKSEHDELSLSLGDDLNSFLECCSQFAAQLDEAAKEENHILDSLFKWFQRQVNQMEEVSKDQSFSEAELPAPDKTVTFSIARVVKHLQKLEELKARLQERSTPSLHIMLSKPKIGENPLETVQSYEKVQEKIEEFIKTHAPEGFTDVTGPSTAYLIPDRLNAMLKIFERQSNILERTKNDHSLLETKYKQILTDLQVLSEEKLVLQNELQRLRNSEKSYDRTKKTMKMDKKKAKEKSEVSEEKKSPVKELKMEDLLKAQKVASALETENKILQEQLKKATQEADKARHQLKYFLNQGELLKSDMKNKATVENSNSKRDVKSKDSKSIPLEMGTRIAEVADSSGQKTNANIQKQPRVSVVYSGSPIESRSEKKSASSAVSELSQILESQDGSALLKTSNEVSADENLCSIIPSNTRDRLSTESLLSKEIQDLLSVGPSLPGKTVTSFISPRKPVGTDISKADILEKKLQSKTEKQTYQEERKFKAYDDASENLMLKHEDSVSETEMQVKKQNTSQDEILIVPGEDSQLLHQNSISKTQVQIKKQRISNAHGKAPDEYLMLQHQGSASKTKMQVKKQRSSKGERLTTHDKAPDEQHPVLQHQGSVSKTKMQVKKQRSSKGERLTTQSEVLEENHVLEHQDSIMSASEIQIKVQIPKGEELTTHEVEDTSYENIFPMEFQVPLSKSQFQTKKLGNVKTEILNEKEVWMTDKNVFPGKSTSDYHPQNQDMNILSSGNFTLKDLELATQRSSVNNEAASELPGTAEKLAGIIPSINELIFQFDSNKVIETDIEHLRESVERLTLMDETKTQSKSLLGINVGHPTDAIAHGIIKEHLNSQSMNLPGADTEHLPSAFGRGLINGQVKAQLKNHAGNNVDHPTDAITRGIIKEHLTSQSMNLLANDTGPLLSAFGRGLLKEEVKTQSKIQIGINVDHPTNTIAHGIIKEHLKSPSLHLPEIKKDHPTYAIAHGIIKERLKSQSMNLTDDDTGPILSAFGRGLIKEKVKAQSKTQIGINEERPTDAIAHGIIKKHLKSQFMHLTDTEREQILDSSGKSLIKGELKTQSTSHAETDKEHLTHTVGKDKIIAKLQEQLKDYSGVNLFKSRDMPTQHQNVFTKLISPSKFATNVINFSPFDNQGMNLFKNKNMSSYHQEDFFTRHTTPSKSPRKIANLSSFDTKDKYEDISPQVTEPSKALSRTSRAGSSIYKTIQFPALDNEPPGHPRTSIINSINVEMTNILPPTISKGKKVIYKVPHTSTGKPSTLP